MDLPTHALRAIALAPAVLAAACHGSAGGALASPDGDAHEAEAGSYSEDTGAPFWSDCNDEPLCACGAPCAGRPVQITTGAVHSCVRYDTGGVLCWGMIRGVASDPSAYRADRGVFASFGEPRRPAIRAPEGIDDTIAIGAGDFHTCALRRDRTLWCWGQNGDGQLGFDDKALPERRAPAAVPDLTDVNVLCADQTWTGGSRAADDRFVLFGAGLIEGRGKAIGCGGGLGFNCWVEPDRTALCWGANLRGTLGDGEGKPERDVYKIPAEVLSDIRKIDGGSDHACALRGHGELWCWGGNWAGQCGRGTANQDVLAPGPVVGLSDVVDFSAEGNVTCAVQRSGQLSCWGGDLTGILAGTDPLAGVSSPVPIAGEDQVMAVSLSDAHGCLIRRNGEVACWGGNHTGATGPHASQGSGPGPVVIEELPRPRESSGSNGAAQLP